MEKLYPLFEIASIIAKEKIGSITEAEQQQLQKWLRQNSTNKHLYEKLKADKLLINDWKQLEKFDSTKAFKKIEKKIQDEKKTRVLLPNYLKYAAAIAIVIIGSYFTFHYFKNQNHLVTPEYAIAPGTQKAILVTAQQQQIELDNTTGERFIKGEEVQILQSGSKLDYHSDSKASANLTEVSYNTLITPKGSEYSVVLSDGTEVMLNACSKLKYPVVFNTEARMVELEGEALFKVRKSLKTPFIVKTSNVNIKVYGTVFNVSAYSNDNKVQTTLAEGSVGIAYPDIHKAEELKLNPGQQNTFDKSTGNIETKEVDAASFMAWSRGLFVFENEPIENILRVLSRWYAFDYEFKDVSLKQQRFTISISRYSNASGIFDMIAASSHLRFSMKDNVIRVFSE